MLLLPMHSVNASESINPTNYIKYASAITTFPVADLVGMYSESDSFESFFAELEEVIAVQAIAYDKPEYDELDEITTVDLNEFSRKSGINLQLLSSHLEKFGNYRYSNFIERYETAFLNTVNIGTESNAALNSSGNYTSEGGISKEDWEDFFYEYANAGNIFITKDNTSSGIRHGHVGVVQSHADSGKMITEALGDRQNVKDEVVCRSLNTYWPNCCTLNVVYPNTSLENRQRAGAQTYWYGYESSYSYETISLKTNLKKSDYTSLNCVGVAYRAYYFMAQYDIVPQVSDIMPLLPMHVDQSPNIIHKTKIINGNNYIFKTDNYDDVDWILL